jgi:hypothetical protein
VDEQEPRLLRPQQVAISPSDLTDDEWDGRTAKTGGGKRTNQHSFSRKSWSRASYCVNRTIISFLRRKVVTSSDTRPTILVMMRCNDFTYHVDDIAGVRPAPRGISARRRRNRDDNTAAVSATAFAPAGAQIA